MANFTIPRNTDQEIAGPSSELVGRVVALRPEGTANIKTEYGVSPATRVTAVGAADGRYEYLGLRLIFWSDVQKSLKAVDSNSWVVGKVAQVPQANNPDRTIYVLEAPSADELTDFPRALDAFETDEAHGLLVS